MPVAARTRIKEMINRLTSREQRRPPLDNTIRRQLAEALTPKITQLGRLLGRDLSHCARLV